MNIYTVLLLYPDYLQDSHPLPDTYLSWIKADTIPQAVGLIQHEAALANELNPEQADDFLVLAVFRGQIFDCHHEPT
jgi:hypothetical protein